jgi:hypothetical protein
MTGSRLKPSSGNTASEPLSDAAIPVKRVVDEGGA